MVQHAASGAGPDSSWVHWMLCVCLSTDCQVSLGFLACMIDVHLVLLEEHFELLGFWRTADVVTVRVMIIVTFVTIRESHMIGPCEAWDL